jgi:hypothetical protein
MTVAKLRLALARTAQRDTKFSALCEEMGFTRQTLYLRPNSTCLQLRSLDLLWRLFRNSNGQHDYE